MQSLLATDSFQTFNCSLILAAVLQSQPGQLRAALQHCSTGSCDPRQSLTAGHTRVGSKTCHSEYIDITVIFSCLDY